MLMRCDEDRVARCPDVRMCSSSTGSRALTACVYTCVYSLYIMCLHLSLCQEVQSYSSRQPRKQSHSSTKTVSSTSFKRHNAVAAKDQVRTHQSPGVSHLTFYPTRDQVVSEREEEELLSLSPQPSIISTVTHGATKKNLIHPSKERDYGGAKYGGGASTERAEVTTDTFTQPYPLAHHLVVHITLFQFSCPPFLQFSGSFYIISDFGDFNM